ncbi:MAG: diol dehydratase small subunit [Lentilactobacillus diolivorans]|jgi:propanediol dehydratase small subunit|uniref:diol dehydratase small subunit n=1 Tax=Lentilactobacillus diolivorans TaxID=179838 RepID=UPI000FEFB452|nr:diol dehydratase small subunit [Lentilactobacillus diolivorans]MCH4165293.1 diol dehydratase small subunit [Lentilactobacillus diolivorans]MDH5106524.1 diol dehydratase small subunit [Lentilactobacillus diolivorans]RRG03129.1 MAG: propanediol dehydratase small subunit PduE [Lactobacillus sp.]
MNDINNSNVNSDKKYGVDDYPLYKKHRDIIKTPSGKALDDITLDDVANEKIDRKDLRITPEALKMQGDVAGAAGKETLQRNFDRAAELTNIPDDRLLEMYNALRPYRSTKQDLLGIADELRSKYHATICASWFEDAAKYYESRKKLKGDNK